MKGRFSGNRARGLRAHSRGFATLEILIAFALLSLTLTAMILVAFSNQSVSVDTQTNAEAIAIARDQLESARASALQNFAALNSQSTQSVPEGSLTYGKKLDVTQIDTYTKQATSTVTWQTGGRSFSVILSTLLTDVAGALTSGSCAQTLESGWNNPSHTEFNTQDLISPASGNHSNGLGVSDIIAVGSKLYITAVSTDNFKNTFYIFDLPTDTTHMPVYDGSVDNNAASADGLNAVAIGRSMGNTYAYVANAHDANFQTCTQGPSCSQLQVIDATTPTAPSVIVSYKLPGVLGNMTSNGQAVGKSIFYYKGYVYLGLTKTAGGPEFHIIDVSNPASPLDVGSYALGHTVTGIVVKGNYAYLSVDDNTRELYVLDITNKTNPQLVGRYDAPLNDSPGNNSGLGNSVFVTDTNVYLGRTYSLSNGDAEFLMLDDANPASALPLVASKDVGTAAAPDSVNGVAVKQNLAFLWTNTAFEIFQISGGSITPYASIPMANFITSGNPSNANGTSLNCSGNYFYLSLVSPQGNNKDIISVVTPGFDYALSAAPASLAFTKANPGTETITVTNQGSAPAQQVTVTLSNLPSTVSATALPPASGSCTPTTGSCDITFQIAVSNTGHKTGTVTATGMPLSHTATFDVVAN